MPPSKPCLILPRSTKAPLISSHHALRAFVDIPRNLDDEALLAIKKTGGVVQLVAFDSYLKPVPEEKLAARRELGKRYGIDSFEAFLALTDEEEAAYMWSAINLMKPGHAPLLPHWSDHIDYAVKLLGVNHVGIVSDFEGGGGIEGWDDASETLNVTTELVRRGYSERDIKKIWGGNLLRVMEEVENVAKKM